MKVVNEKYQDIELDIVPFSYKCSNMNLKQGSKIIMSIIRPYMFTIFPNKLPYMEKLQIKVVNAVAYLEKL